MKTGMKTSSTARAERKHGWENHGGKPPFPGAAHPIHLQKGGKYHKGKKGKKG